MRLWSHRLPVNLREGRRNNIHIIWHDRLLVAAGVKSSLCERDRHQQHTAAVKFTVCEEHLRVVVQLLSGKDGIRVCKTQEWLFRDLGTERSSNCSTGTSIQRLEKNQVWLANKTSFSPLHWIYCLFFCVLTLRECLLTRVKWTKAEDDPELGQGAGGPGGCGSMTVDQAEERTEWIRKRYGCDNGFPH